MTAIEPTLRRPETLTAVGAAAAIESRTLTCEALVRACLERIALRESIIWISGLLR